MTLLSSFSSFPPVSLSSLTEASVSLPQQLLRHLASLAEQHPRTLSFLDGGGSSSSSSLSKLSNNIPNTSPTSLAAAAAAALLFSLLAGLLAVFVAMSWRDPFAFWRRNQSYPAQPGGSPHVRDSDYTYLTGDDDSNLADSRRSHHQPPYHQPHPQPQYIERRPVRPVSDEDGPDIILLKHRGITYPLHFPPYAIDDGDLTVGEIRRRAAEKTAATDLQRVKILYKGKLLRDDDRPCKDEGLKQQSEIMCIVSDVRPGESTSDLSGSENDKSSSLDSGSVAPRPSKTQRKNEKKKAKKKKKKHDEAAAASAAGRRTPDLSPSLADGASAGGGGGLAPPVDQRPTSSSGRSASSAAPSPAPSLQNLRTGNAQVDALLQYLRGELAPMCEEYLAHPPAEAKAREYEYKRLSETILAQVILKADGIEAEDARTARRALIKEAQSWLHKIDGVDRD